MNIQSIEFDFITLFNKSNSFQASAYLKQGKYKEAEQLYREVLTAASEKDKPDDMTISSTSSNPANLNKVNSIKTQIYYIITKYLI